MPLKKNLFTSNSALIKALTIITYCSILTSCSNSVAIGEQDKLRYSSKQAFELQIPEDSNYKGWDFLAEKLIKDGIPKTSVALVFNDDRMPAISFIPFKLNPVESNQIYNNVTSKERLDRAESFLSTHQDSFTAAEKKYGVTRFAIAAIISVETNWGSYVGTEKVVNRLARVSSAGEPQNLRLNFEKLKSEDPSVSFEATQQRAKYLFETFYPHVVALFHSYSEDSTKMLDLKGSVAGAFGLPQFLPKSLELFGVDGNNDGVVDLFTPEDAIFSVANFLKSSGWRKNMDPQQKLEVLWHYNRSEAYGRAIIRVALSLQNRFLKLN